ncbi:MAG: aminotransferase class III-fold pyridoxal phosphate-dependent enzyme [Cyclobacteriaceae bacterium]
MRNSGIELWKKAKKLIPTGNQLLSKRSERFLPGLWPSYYKKAKGCEVWDLDDNHYYDFAQMGVGSCSLGYADEDVNRAVLKAVENGSMATLNSYEEVELAEKLLEIHPWAEMARFSRAGGEACAIAIRIARAASGKGKIAFCGYHGWHDWYISANLNEGKNLDEQLLPGLKPNGVIDALNGSTHPFRYNEIDDLKKIVSEVGNELGVIVMEPVRSNPPKDGFLEEVREIASSIGAVLIFDEVTSGFRMNYGGIHLKYGINPDMAIFGKALGNGFPISAIIGKREIMQAAESSFISSTFWTERVGFVAALATLEKMKEKDVQASLSSFGERINDGWNRLAAKHDLQINISGLPPLTHISFGLKSPVKAQTYYTQEMLKKGYLLGASVYSTFAYSNEIIDGFIDASDDIFGLIKKMDDEDRFDENLEGDVIETGFKRMN